MSLKMYASVEDDSEVNRTIKFKKVCSAPNWLRPELFLNILTEIILNFKEIKKVTIEPALNNAVNGITILLRVRTRVLLKDDSKEKMHFVLKIPLEDSNVVGNGAYNVLFLYENDMYDRVIAELEEISGEQFKAKHYKFASPQNCHYILMEDLVQQGFQNLDRLMGLDELQTKLVLVKLAQWHAASAKRVESKGEYCDNYRNSYFIEAERELIKSMNESFTTAFIECMESYKIDNELKRKIRIYLKSLNNAYMKFGEIVDSNFNVLNHGEFWLNNIMFRFVDDCHRDITDIYFIDFQLPKYGNPAQDLFCFLITSTQMEIKLKKFDNFIAFYHGKLLEQLRILGYRKVLPSIAHIHSRLHDGGVWGFICAQRLLAFALVDPFENSNLETFLSKSLAGVSYKKRLFYNPRYVEQIESILPWLSSKNYLRIEDGQ